MRKLVFVVLLAALGLAGCGDGGGGDVDPAGEGAAGDPEFTGKGGRDFCEYLRELEEKEDELNLGGGESSQENQEKAKKALDIFDDLEEKAPPELSKDVKLVLTQVRPLFRGIADGKDATTVATSNPPSEAEQKEFDAASARVEAYSKNVCGIADEDAPADGGAGDSGSTEDEQAPAEEDAPAEG